MNASIRGRVVLIAVAALLALPAAAEAGTVSVEEQLTVGPITKSTLHFAATPGEANAVIVTIPAPAPADSPPRTLETMQVLDSGAPLSAGSGCSGGGPAGTPVLCTMFQIAGGSIGLGLTTTVFSGAIPPFVDGFQAAFRLDAALALVGLAVVVLFVGGSLRGGRAPAAEAPS